MTFIQAFGLLSDADYFMSVGSKFINESFQSCLIFLRKVSPVGYKTGFGALATFIFFCHTSLLKSNLSFYKKASYNEDSVFSVSGNYSSYSGR